jgi:hypothetical protein
MNTSTQSPDEHRGKTISDSPEKTDTQIRNQLGQKYTWHWHVLLVHFPTSAFLGSFVFMMLHLITMTTCFELAAFVSLILGALVMIPTTISGWITWKRKYKGIKGKIFLSKIRISFAMIAVSIALIAYRSTFVTEDLDVLHNAWHFLFYVGGTLLFVGAVAEGYFGGRLNHR